MRVLITRLEGYESPKVNAAQGEVADVNEHLAAKLIATGWAVPAPPRPAVIETTAAAPPENTAVRTAKAKARSSRPAKEG